MEAVALSVVFVQTRCVEAAHRRVQSHSADIEVRIRLADVGVSQQLLHVVDRPTRFEPPRPGLVPQVVEVQIDDAECLA
jgi:hypothetical protein